MAGNVTVTDVRDLAGICEAYLQAHTDGLLIAIARIVGDNGPDPSVAPLVSEERLQIEDERLPMFEGRGGTHVHGLTRHLSRRHHP